MKRGAAWVVLALGGCHPLQPSRHPEPVVDPSLLSPGSAGTISMFENVDSHCEWSRIEPGERPVLVHEFPLTCPDVRVTWSEDGEHALLLFIGWRSDAWEANFVSHTLARIEPVAGETGQNGFMAPDGSVTLSFFTSPRPATGLLHKLGLGQDCEAGRIRALRSSAGGAWRTLDTRPYGCGFSEEPEVGRNYLWEERPGVQDTLDWAALTDAVAPAKIDSVRRRGEWYLVTHETGQVQLAKAGHAEPLIPGARLEFWPARVRPEWLEVTGDFPPPP